MKITLTTTIDNKLTINIDKPMRVDEIMPILGTAMLSTMNSFIAKVPEEDREAMKHEMYDNFNFLATNILEMFAPEYELRPGLTTQAILEAENRLMAEAVKEHDNA